MTVHQPHTTCHPFFLLLLWAVICKACLGLPLLPIGTRWKRQKTGSGTHMYYKSPKLPPTPTYKSLFKCVLTSSSQKIIYDIGSLPPSPKSLSLPAFSLEQLSPSNILCKLFFFFSFLPPVHKLHESRYFFLGGGGSFLPKAVFPVPTIQ